MKAERTYTMYSGISKKAWETIWSTMDLHDRETNVTTDLTIASEYSYCFESEEYDDLVIEISNIPKEAFVACRDDDYADDDDFISFHDLEDSDILYNIEHYSLFLVDLFKYKDSIKVKLIKV
jgi:hypothetical protein